MHIKAMNGIIFQFDEAESESGSDEEKESKSKAYVAPRLAAVPYSEILSWIFIRSSVHWIQERDVALW